MKTVVDKKFDSENGYIDAQVGIKRNDKRSQFIGESLVWLANEFEMYVADQNETPFYYNESALLGFYNAALVRNAGAIILQDYSCEKINGKGMYGRSDLWFKTKNEKQAFAVEAKVIDTKINTDEDWPLSDNEDALRQLSNYNTGTEIHNQFSLYFQRIWQIKNVENNENLKSELTENYWLDIVGALKYFDFYAIYNLGSEALQPQNGGDSVMYNFPLNNEPTYYYPALAVHGLFKKNMNR